MLNKCQIIGRLGRDPELRYLADGTAVANISVACSEQWKDKSTGEKKESTEWFRVSIFGRIAEVCGEYLHKGDLAYFEGKMKTRDWTDKDGVKRYATELHANEMKMLQTRGTRDGDSDPQQDERGRREPAPHERASGTPGAAERPAAGTYGSHRGGGGSYAPQNKPATGTGFDSMDDDIPF